MASTRTEALQPDVSAGPSTARRGGSYIAASLQNGVAERLVALRSRARLATSFLRGRKAYRAESRRQAEDRLHLEQLASRLGWPVDALPTTGGWAGSAQFLSLLSVEVLARRPQVTVEFGSGLSTLVIARCLELGGFGGRLVSYDHNAGFADLTRQRLAAFGLAAEVHAVPLGTSEPYGYAGRWYLPYALPPEIDLAVVDGPPAWLRAGTRGGAAPIIFPRLRPGGAVILDDAARPGEQENARRWQREYPAMRFRLIQSEKGQLIGEKLHDGGGTGAEATSPADGATDGT